MSMRSGPYIDNAPPYQAGMLNYWLSSHPIITELLVLGAYVFAYVVGLAWRWSTADGILRLVMILNGLILLACLLARKSSPALVATVGLVTPVLFTELIAVSDSIWHIEGWSTYVGPGVYPFDLVSAAILVFTVGTYRRPQLCWAITATGIVCAAACLWVTADSQREAAVMSLISTMGLITMAFAGQNLRTSRLRLVELEQRNQQVMLERDQREQLAVTTERNRIAREMHDVVAHSLAVMVTIADGAHAMIDKNPEVAKNAIGELAQTGRQALADTRRLVGVLRDDAEKESDPNYALPSDSTRSIAPLEPQPTIDDVQELVNQFKRTGLPIHFKQVGGPLPKINGLHLAVYRIIQESLTNILKYAPATPHIQVVIRRNAGMCTITVTNAPGEESTIVSGSNKGLIGMRERAAVFNGTVEAGPYRGGWRVHAKLYWEEPKGSNTK